MTPLPSAVDTERALLGGLIQDPDQIDDVAVRVADFYRDDHARLFALLCDMRRAGEVIDLVTVPERVTRGGGHNEYGGVAYVVQLADHCPSPQAVPEYARIVRDKAVLRALIRDADAIRRAALEDPGDVGDLVTRAGNAISQLADVAGSDGWTSTADLTADRLAAVERRMESMKADGVSTGFRALDGILTSLAPGQLVILAARPAMGKSTAALNIAQNVAVMEGRAVAVFSLEMTRGELVDRQLCATALVDAGQMRSGALRGADLSRLMEARGVLDRHPLHIDDTPGLTISEVRARSTRLKARHPDLALIVIDYLQLMRGDDPRVIREQQVAAISGGLKALAKDLGVCVVALSQLNRSVEARQNKRPGMADLRESGSIEQDADVVAMIYRDEVYNENSDDKGAAEVIIVKQRGGSTGTVKLGFRGRFVRFDDLDDDSAWIGGGS